jgi:hypothetical protein
LRFAGTAVADMVRAVRRICMRKLLSLLVLAGVVNTTFAAKPAPSAAPNAQQKIRTFLSYPDLPRQALKNRVSPKFYRSLTVSPVEAYVVARAPVRQAQSSGAQIIRSDAGGMWDEAAKGLANSIRFEGMNTVESRVGFSHVDVHLLVYKIADGLMVVGFTHVDDPKYAGYTQYGRATIGFLQNGKWTFMDNKLRR